MAKELNMPQMGYDMQEGTLVRWLKSEGAEIATGEAIAEIETDKGHDSFLLDEPELDRSIKGFLNSNFDIVLEDSK